MVSRGARDGRGASTIGCLVSLLIFVAVLYYGVNIGEVWLRYYRFVDEMKVQARLAAAIDDGTIRRRLQASAQEIGLPPAAAEGLVIRRTAGPREIRIETRYSEPVNLPLFHRTFNFNPKVSQPL